MTDKFIIFLNISTCLAAMTAVPAVHAQTGESESSMADIVVTATRQAEPLSRVPISIAAFDQQSMDAQGVRSINDLARLTPGLRISAAGTSPNDVTGVRSTIAIRGITSSAGAATTGIYINETPIQVRATGNTATTAYPLIFDLDRVEVLRGPQGTLFGAGAQGGVVRFITPAPGLDRYSGYARTEIAATEGGDMSYEAGAAVGGPIVDGKLGFRASGWYRRDGGWIDRVDFRTRAPVNRNANGSDSYTLRGALSWEPVADLRITASVFHQKQVIDNPPLMFADLTDIGTGTFLSGRVLDQPRRDRFTLPTLDIEYSLGSVRLISNTSYFRRQMRYDADYTNFIGALLLGDPRPSIAGQYDLARFRDDQRNFSQELRLQSDGNAPLDWVFGVYFGQSKQRARQTNVSPFLDRALIQRYGVGVAAVLGRPLDPGDIPFFSDLHSVDKQIAGFGQADYEIADGLTLTAGLRIADVKLRYDQSIGGPFSGGPSSFGERQHEQPITPKFGLSYQADPDNLLYASVSKGFRIGGINPALLAACNAQAQQIGITGNASTYDADSVWSYEVGSKNRVLGGRLRIDASLFRIDWRNIQRRIQLATCGSTIIANLGSASSTGFELSLQAAVSDRLSVGVNAGYTDARLEDTLLSGGARPFGVKGDKLDIPPWSVALSGEYRFDVREDRDAYLRADYQFVSEAPNPNLAVVGVDPTILRGSQAINQLSLRAGLQYRGVDLSLFVDNVLKSQPILGRSRDTLASSLYYVTTLRPRTAGLTATYRY